MISVDGLTVEFGGTTLFSPYGKERSRKVNLVKDFGWGKATYPWKSYST